MRNRLPVRLEDNDLPNDIYKIKDKRNDSYGYVNILYLTSIIITVLSVMTVIFVGK
jgi:hypothetical protein